MSVKSVVASPVDTPPNFDDCADDWVLLEQYRLLKEYEKVEDRKKLQEESRQRMRDELAR